MICPDCNFNFSKEEAKFIDENTVVCPHCSSMISFNSFKEKEVINHPQNANIEYALKITSMIVLLYSIYLFVAGLYKIEFDESWIQPIISLCSEFLRYFIISILLYSFSKIISILAEIRDKIKN